MTRGPYRTKPIPGSWSALIADFRKTGKYRGWSVLTKRHADRVMDDWRTEHGQKQVATLTLGSIVRLRDSISETPDAANNWFKIMRHLLTYAKRTEYITVNPLEGAGLERLSPNRPGGFRTWRDDEIAVYRAFWPLGTTPRLVLELAVNTGASPVDLVKLGWGNVLDGRLRYRRQKTERSKGAEETPLVDVPITPALAEALALVPADRTTFLQTAWGEARSQGALSHHMRRWVAEAGLGDPDRYGRFLRLHGLRKALGRQLAEAGVAPHGIMSVLGHESIASAQVYTKAYDRARAADDALGKLAGAEPTNVTRIRRPKDG